MASVCPGKSPWFARLYDPLMAPIELIGMRRKRRAVVADAAGCVLEVGAGTGLNLPHYRRARRVIATDPDPEMLYRARKRASHAPGARVPFGRAAPGHPAAVPVTLLVADAQALPFADGSFDTVVATCVFCTIPDPERAFRELRRVLKPRGEVRLLEHVRAPAPAVARLQDRLTPAWSRIAGGCHLNRDTLASARRAGFAPETLRSWFGGVVLSARLRPREPE